MSTKIIAIFGAETPLGAAVALQLAKSGKYALRIYQSGEAGSNIESQLQLPASTQVKYISARASANNNNDAGGSGSAIARTLHEVYGCYLITRTDFLDSDMKASKRREIEFGRAVAEACRTEHVPHLVCQTQLSPFQVLGITARHLDAKFEIEQLARKMGLPATFVITPTFFEQILDVLKPDPMSKGVFRNAIPTGLTRIDWMCIEDAAIIIASLFEEEVWRKHAGRTISLSACKLAAPEVAAGISKRLAPIQIKDLQMTRDDFRSRNVPGVNDLASAFEFLVRVDQKCDVDYTQELLPSVRNLERWLDENTDRVRRVLSE